MIVITGFIAGSLEAGVIIAQGYHSFVLNGELCPNNYYLNKFLRLKCLTTNAKLI